MAWRWPAGIAGLVVVLAAAGSAPFPPDDDAALSARCLKAAQEMVAKYRGTNISVALICDRPDGTPVDPKLWVPAAPTPPAPTPVTTAGRPGCVTGPGRPVAGTALTTASAATGSGEPIRYDYQQLDGGETVSVSGSPVLEFGPGDLAPGGTYRWRARVDQSAQPTRDAELLSRPDDEAGWSPWCEFTVSASAVDYRQLGDVSLEALNALGLRPDRKYAVTLSGRQQRLLREGTDIGRTSTRMTLTGPRWTDLLIQLSEEAAIADEVAAELAGEDAAPPDGTAYRTLVDAISVKLGGPRHPTLG